MSERPARPGRDDFGHFHELATRWSDCDMLGHVNNARYYSFDESARLDYFGEMIAGRPGFWGEQGFILAHLACDFIEQLHHPSTIRFGFRIRRIGRSSMNTEGALFVGERLIAVTRGVLLWFNYRDNKPVPVPDYARAYIRGKERLAPEEV
ncbi:acyl-CoA thioesterase [Solimonas soli]|uniref:acyl-CoA thioesterase n=1 Tax=Solimonas soli TaxID=413479 RepID=UPI0004ADCA5D|nr:thioesterase family protein [Solimonas soli]